MQKSAFVLAMEGIDGLDKCEQEVDQFIDGVEYVIKSASLNYEQAAYVWSAIGSVLEKQAAGPEQELRMLQAKQRAAPENALPTGTKVVAKEMGKNVMAGTGTAGTQSAIEEGLHQMSPGTPLSPDVGRAKELARGIATGKRNAEAATNAANLSKYQAENAAEQQHGIGVGQQSAADAAAAERAQAESADMENIQKYMDQIDPKMQAQLAEETKPLNRMKSFLSSVNWKDPSVIRRALQGGGVGAGVGAAGAGLLTALMGKRDAEGRKHYLRNMLLGAGLGGVAGAGAAPYINPMVAESQGRQLGYNPYQ